VIRWLRRVLGVRSPSEEFADTGNAFSEGFTAGQAEAERHDFQDRSLSWFVGSDRSAWLAQRRMDRLLKIGESPAFDQVRRSARAFRLFG
jgi:hypothetical protein